MTKFKVGDWVCVETKHTFWTGRIGRVEEAWRGLIKVKLDSFSITLHEDEVKLFEKAPAPSAKDQKGKQVPPKHEEKSA